MSIALPIAPDAPSRRQHVRLARRQLAVFSPVAERVEVCLFDPDGNEQRVELPGRQLDLARARRESNRDGVMDCVHGPASKDGHQLLPAKLLVDPYAHDRRPPGGTTRSSRRARATITRSAGRTTPLRAEIGGGARAADQAGIERPHAARRDDRLRAHVKGFTATHPLVARAARHLRRPGAPCRAHASARARRHRGRADAVSTSCTGFSWSRRPGNFWGYDPIQYFAPSATTRATPPRSARHRVREWWRRPRRGHRSHHDVVFNHTGRQ
jgi:glycogen operon protein